jgi:hypothetical protein
MPVPVPSSLVDFILLGPLDDRRQLQDSPILGDVWVAFGATPAGRVDLLLTPFRGQHAGAVASDLSNELTTADCQVSYLQGIIAAKLTFEEVLRVVIPKTRWWLDLTRRSRRDGATWNQVITPQRTEEMLRRALQAAQVWHDRTGDPPLMLQPHERFLAITALILWAGMHDPKQKRGAAPADPVGYVLRKAKSQMSTFVQALVDLLHTMGTVDDQARPRIHLISRNRRAMPALSRSISAVKADAVSTLFKVSCRDICWAVVDSGIDGSHPAFFTTDGQESRVRRSFDFTNFRRIVSLSNLKQSHRSANVSALVMDNDALAEPPLNAEEDLQLLANDARENRPIHWDLVRRFVEIKTDTPPSLDHGTHVAGILAANSEAYHARTGGRDRNNLLAEEISNGMCPDISLYDFRVLGRTVEDTEFAIIAALQFIRFLNDRDKYNTIHGANLSLSIPHDVRNYACGRTPICDECERLMDSGVLVVAAAGNHGHKSFETKDGAYESYAAFSITDPGNAESVITVGSTHRFWPHTYGVSFFSSRGPTGDGRLKPDLVAPGERIRAPLPGEAWGDQDGTSMAAPHVSGAAAMLMSRYSELIRQPRKIKHILCSTATDLGRERSFQGHGMLDVLRAFQSI